MGDRESLAQDHGREAVAVEWQPSTKKESPLALLRGERARVEPRAFPAVTLGELVAIADDGQSPLVIYIGQPGSAAVRARSTVDVHAVHIGRAVTLTFENGDPALPIVTGVICRIGDEPQEAAGHVEVDSDGKRMVVQARDQLVLRCGKASITLTRAGKVLIEGSYVLSRSTGMNRIRGGAVQIN